LISIWVVIGWYYRTSRLQMDGNWNDGLM